MEQIITNNRQYRIAKQKIINSWDNSIKKHENHMKLCINNNDPITNRAIRKYREN